MVRDRESEHEYLVGYKRPPRHTQFRPGQSGNVHGRPRKTRTFAEIVEKEGNRSIVITENQQPLKVKKVDAVVKRQFIKALEGNAKATELIVKALDSRQTIPSDELSPLLLHFRADHARDEAISLNPASPPNVGLLPGGTADGSVTGNGEERHGHD